MVREANVKQATAEKQLKEAQGKVSLGAFLMDGETVGRRSHECPDALGGCCYWRSSTSVTLGSCRTTSEHKAHTAPVTLDAGVYSTTASLQKDVTVLLESYVCFLSSLGKKSPQ